MKCLFGEDLIGNKHFKKKIAFYNLNMKYNETGYNTNNQGAD